MGYVSATEQAALDEMEPRWRAQGYRLVRHPARDQLPEFLRNFQPDAIAVGATPGLVIEIVNPRSKAASTKVAQLAGLFESQDGWRLEVVYAPSEFAEVSLSSVEEISEALGDSRRLLDVEPRAALLLAWGALEATGRRLHPSMASQEMTSASLVELLVSQGNLPLDDQAALRRIARKRNAIAHGDLAVAVDRDEVLRIVQASRQLLARMRPSDGTGAP